MIVSFDQEPKTIFQLIPHKNLRNYHNEKLVSGYCEFGERIFNRVEFKNRKLAINPLKYINFKIYLSPQTIKFFVTCPASLKDYIHSKIESSWDKITVTEIDNYPFVIDPEKCFTSQLVYRKHDILSLKTDKDITYPLRSIFNTINEMKENEFVVIDILGEPYKRHYWEYEAKEAYDKFKRGIMPRNIMNLNKDVLHYVGIGMNYIFNNIHNTLNEIGSGKRNENVILDEEVKVILQQGLSNSTLSKLNSEVLKTWIKIFAYSEKYEKARILNSVVAGCYKELSAENELDNIFGESRFNSNKMSIYEWSKLTMLATAELQKDFQQIQNVRLIESVLPDELFQNTGIKLCNVTEKGLTRVAKLPIHDTDILCMPHLAFGMMRTGKSEGFGNNMAHEFITHGFSSFVLETNDGLSLDVLRDSLPEDYPDEKIIEVDLGNLYYPIALSWNDSLSRNINSNDEVEQAKIAEKLTAHIITFVNNLTTEKFSDKMMYYLNAGKAVLANPNKGLLDMLLALTSCSYREELMNEDYIKEQNEIYDILKILQDKSIGSTDMSTLEPILTRMNLLTGNRFLSNLFLQEPKIKENRPVLDFRKYMDNSEGGYGYCVLIRIPKAEFTSDIVNILASFMISKIWTCALSRIDMKKENRKPFVFICDEPHQYIEGSGNLYKECGVESGKYRMKLVWLAHSLGQFGEFKSALTDGGCQYTAYKTKTFKGFKELESEFKPHDIVELYEDLPKRWVAVNKIYLPESDDVPAFIGDMLPPPGFVKDRSYRRLECSKNFGRSFKEVSGYISKARDRRKLDEELIERMKEVKKEKKKVGRPKGRVTKVII